MSTMTVSQARARFAQVVDQVRIDRDPVYLTRHDRAVAAVIGADELNRLIEAAEDLADITAARLAREEMASGASPIPWDEVKRDLGLE